jgi:hypothetical protein
MLVLEERATREQELFGVLALVTFRKQESDELMAF